MLSKKLEKALNDQINYELYSAYIYYAMAAYFDSTDLPGFSNWMQVQVREELVHADKLFRFIADRDGRARLAPIKGPELEWKSPLEVFTVAHDHEVSVTKRIHAIVDLARAEKDHAVENFLQWFVTEQVEEEASTKAIVQQLKRLGNEGHALFMVDRELAQRIFTPPPAGA